MTRTIVNLSLAPPSRELRRRGVFELPTTLRFELQQLLSFQAPLPGESAIYAQAGRVADLADYVGASKALIDVPQFLVSSLEDQLIQREIIPMYAWGFVKRYEVETDVEDSNLVKCKFMVTNLFPSPSWGARNG